MRHQNDPSDATTSRSALRRIVHRAIVRTRLRDGICEVIGHKLTWNEGHCYPDAVCTRCGKPRPLSPWPPKGWK